MSVNPSPVPTQYATPPGEANRTTVYDALVGSLDAIRADFTAVESNRQTLVTRLAAAAPTTLAGAVAQLRELQGIGRDTCIAVERIELAALRLARLVTGLLDATD